MLVMRESRSDARDLRLIREMSLEIVSETTTKKRRDKCWDSLIAACDRYALRHEMDSAALVRLSVKKAREARQ
jgi:hypothetical protein